MQRLLRRLLAFLACLASAAASNVANVSIFFVGPQQMQPWGSRQTPCSVVDEPGCKGGYPNIAAVIRHERTRVPQGSVTVGEFVQMDRLVQLHESGLLLNDELWTRLDVQTLKMKDPYFLSWSNVEAVARRVSKTKLRLGATNLELRDQWMVFRGVFSYHDIVSPAPGITVGLLFGFPEQYWFATSDPEETLRSYVRFLRSYSVSAVVVLVSSKVSARDLRALERIGADVCLFTTVNPQPFAAYNSGTGATTYMIEQPKQSLNTIESLSLTFVNGVLTAASAFVNSTEVIPDALKDDAYRADQAFIQQIVTEADANDKAFAVSTAPMPAGKESGLSPCRDSECPLGTLTTQAIVRARNDEIAFINGGGLRDGWDAGEILRSELTAAVPFQNYLCHLNLTAANILRALEHGVSTITAAGNYNSSADLSGQYLQVHGLRYTVNPSLPPYGRVTGLEVPGADGTWVPIDMQRPYKVATVNYLCDGGDGFTFGANAHDGVFHKSTVDVWTLLVQHMTDLGKITPHTIGVIVYDFDGETLDVMKNEDCTIDERYVSEWEVCEKCPIGFYNPPGSTENSCISVPEKAKNNTAVVVIATVATVMLVCLALALGVRFIRARELLEKQKMRTRFAPKSGLCAIVFTDITQATELWELFPSEMETALATHDEIARELMEECEGYEVKTLGDSFMVAFEDPVLAVDFMMRLQTRLLRAEWPEAMLQHAACRCQGDYFRGLRVRCGCHVGPAVISETHQGGYDYTGTSVNLASRVSDCGEGGQVIITERTYQMIEPHMDALPESVDVRYLGDYSFKGILNTVACYQILPDELAVGRESHFLPKRHNSQPEVDRRTVTSATNPLLVSRVQQRPVASENADKKQFMDAVQTIRRWVLRDGQKQLSSSDIAPLFAGCAHSGTLQIEELVAMLLSMTLIPNAPWHRSRRTSDECADPKIPWVLVQEMLHKLPKHAVVKLAEQLSQPTIGSPVVHELLQSFQ